MGSTRKYALRKNLYGHIVLRGANDVREPGGLVGVDIGQVQETQEIRLETAEDDIKVGVKDDTGDSSIFRPVECNYKRPRVKCRYTFVNLCTLYVYFRPPVP